MRFEFQRILKGETLNLPGWEFQLSLEEMPPWSQRQVSFDNKIRKIKNQKVVKMHNKIINEKKTLT